MFIENEIFYGIIGVERYFFKLLFEEFVFFKVIFLNVIKLYFGKKDEVLCYVGVLDYERNFLGIWVY